MLYEEMNPFVGSNSVPVKSIRDVFEPVSRVADVSLPVLSVSIHSGISDRELDNSERERTVWLSEDRSKYQTVERGDLVYNSMRAWQGGFGTSKIRGLVSPAYGVLKPKSGTYSRYYEYLFRTRYYIGLFDIYSPGIIDFRKRLSWDRFKQVKVPAPSYNTQVEIVEEIDYRLSKINKLKSELDREKRQLMEYRWNLISCAVTKGLNPGLPMKDSGIRWVGKIPSHWQVARVGVLYKLSNGLSKKGEFFGKGYPFVSYGDVYKNIFVPENVSGLVNSSLQERFSCSVRRGDVFFTRTSETIEELALSSVALKDVENATFAGFLIRARPIVNRLLPEFSGFYFRSNCHRNFFASESNLVTRASLSQSLLGKLPVLIPPFSEQKKISDYCQHIDSKIQLIQNRISLLADSIEEYRSSVISKMLCVDENAQC